jgi:hypothetical protein
MFCNKAFTKTQCRTTEAPPMRGFRVLLRGYMT